MLDSLSATALSSLCSSSSNSGSSGDGRGRIGVGVWSLWWLTA
jgi:hypothetical protein